MSCILHIFLYTLVRKSVVSNYPVPGDIHLYLGLNKHIVVSTLVKICIFEKYPVPETFIIIYTANSKETLI